MKKLMFAFEELQYCIIESLCNSHEKLEVHKQL